MGEQHHSLSCVMPAKAGIQYSAAQMIGLTQRPIMNRGDDWVPAFAGTTTRGFSRDESNVQRAVMA
jgi:hypothetical protein